MDFEGTPKSGKGGHCWPPSPHHLTCGSASGGSTEKFTFVGVVEADVAVFDPGWFDNRRHQRLADQTQGWFLDRRHRGTIRSVC